MPMKALDIITAAMKDIGALDPGEVPTAPEAQDGLRALNQMIDAWSGERLMVFTVQRQVFPLVSGQQAYRVGPGGDFNIARPADIVSISIINTNNPSQPLELPLQMLTDAQWQAIPVKAITSSLPLKVWDDGGFPYRTLSYWCVPNTSVDTALYTWTQLSQFAELETTLTFPPGYADALEFNLAMRIAPSFGLTPSPIIVGLAQEARAKVQTINVPIVDLHCDPAVVNPKQSIYNWLSDTYFGQS